MIWTCRRMLEILSVRIILKNQAGKTWFTHLRPQVVNDTKRPFVNRLIDPLVRIHPQAAFILSTNNFARATPGKRYLLLHQAFDKCIQEILSKIPLDYRAKQNKLSSKVTRHVLASKIGPGASG